MRCEQCEKDISPKEVESQLRVNIAGETAKVICRKCAMDSLKVAVKSAGFHLGA